VQTVVEAVVARGGAAVTARAAGASVGRMVAVGASHDVCSSRIVDSFDDECIISSLG
jgi:hypothetical protein